MSLDLSNEAISNCPNVVKAWVNFDGTAGTINIAADHGVDSLTDNGTGQYTINFTVNFTSINYSAALTCVGGQSDRMHIGRDPDTTQTISAFRIDCVETTTNGFSDRSYVSAIFYGDQ
jgi:hypothetical protein